MVHSAVITMAIRLPVLYAPKAVIFALAVPYMALAAFIKRHEDVTTSEDGKQFLHRGTAWASTVWVSEDTPITERSQEPPLRICAVDAEYQLKWSPPTASHPTAQVTTNKKRWKVTFASRFWDALREDSLKQEAPRPQQTQDHWERGRVNKRGVQTGSHQHHEDRPPKHSRPDRPPANWQRSPRQYTRERSTPRRTSDPHKGQRSDRYSTAGAAVRWADQVEPQHDQGENVYGKDGTHNEEVPWKQRDGQETTWARSEWNQHTSRDTYSRTSTDRHKSGPAYWGTQSWDDKGNYASSSAGQAMEWRPKQQPS